jgi:hypothetical protein
MDQPFRPLLDRLDHLPEEFREIREGVQKAVLVADIDPEMALTRSRKVLELVVREVYERRCNEPAGTRPLENLIQRLVKDGHLPDRLDAYATTVRKLGNVGTHSFGERVTAADFHQSLTQLMHVLTWYFDEERPQTPGAGKAGAAPPRPVEPRRASPGGVSRTPRDGAVRLRGYSFRRTLVKNESFLAEEERTGRAVVIEAVPRNRCMLEDDMYRQFVRDGWVASRISHPALVQVYEVIEQDEVCYIVHEKIDGRELNSLEKALVPSQAVLLVARVAEGVGHAHSHGLVHRNLTPRWILVDGSGAPRVRFPGLIEIGTPSYTAPEMLYGTANLMDGRVDVWSLGVILYECLTGERPRGVSPSYLSRSQEGLPIPLRQRNPKLPEELEEICLKCLRREPADRYTTAANLAADLRRVRWKGRSVWHRLWPFRR